jgi:hypothetical protein
VIDHDFGTAGIGELFPDFFKLAPNLLLEPLVALQYIEQVFYLFQNLAVLGNNLVLLQPGQFMQAQIENRLCACFSVRRY